ncbi:hypothetical protein BDV96DRAFT_604090 [Lophiotrema nucula]|uniref:Uncharacterized protein n=1 Tax=Lophiotrema nucula TaxID=690887 RepID=A0A6A5YWM0_9PLEO|nr:hypothetical protein BDV96DRAFT_604090 [Lophiotrema nucula]
MDSSTPTSATYDPERPAAGMSANIDNPGSAVSVTPPALENRALPTAPNAASTFHLNSLLVTAPLEDQDAALVDDIHTPDSAGAAKSHATATSPATCKSSTLAPSPPPSVLPPNGFVPPPPPLPHPPLESTTPPMPTPPGSIPLPMPTHFVEALEVEAQAELRELEEENEKITALLKKNFDRQDKARKKIEDMRKLRESLGMVVMNDNPSVVLATPFEAPAAHIYQQDKQDLPTPTCMGTIDVTNSMFSSVEHADDLHANDIADEITEYNPRAELVLGSGANTSDAEKGTFSGNRIEPVQRFQSIDGVLKSIAPTPAGDIDMEGRIEDMDDAGNRELLTVMEVVIDEAQDKETSGEPNITEALPNLEQDHEFSHFSFCVELDETSTSEDIIASAEATCDAVSKRDEVQDGIESVSAAANAIQAREENQNATGAVTVQEQTAAENIVSSAASPVGGAKDQPPTAWRPKTTNSSAPMPFWKYVDLVRKDSQPIRIAEEAPNPVANVMSVERPVAAEERSISSPPSSAAGASADNISVIAEGSTASRRHATEAKNAKVQIDASPTLPIALHGPLEDGVQVPSIKKPGKKRPSNAFRASDLDRSDEVKLKVLPSRPEDIPAVSVFAENAELVNSRKAPPKSKAKVNRKSAGKKKQVRFEDEVEQMVKSKKAVKKRAQKSREEEEDRYVEIEAEMDSGSSFEPNTPPTKKSRKRTRPSQQQESEDEDEAIPASSTKGSRQAKSTALSTGGSRKRTRIQEPEANSSPVDAPSRVTSRSKRAQKMTPADVGVSAEVSANIALVAGTRVTRHTLKANGTKLDDFIVRDDTTESAPESEVDEHDHLEEHLGKATDSRKSPENEDSHKEYDSISERDGEDSSDSDIDIPLVEVLKARNPATPTVSPNSQDGSARKASTAATSMIDAVQSQTTTGGNTSEATAHSRSQSQHKELLPVAGKKRSSSSLGLADGETAPDFTQRSVKKLRSRQTKKTPARIGDEDSDKENEEAAQNDGDTGDEDVEINELLFTEWGSSSAANILAEVTRGVKTANGRKLPGKRSAIAPQASAPARPPVASNITTTSARQGVSSYSQPLYPKISPIAHAPRSGPRKSTHTQVPFKNPLDGDIFDDISDDESNSGPPTTSSEHMASNRTSNIATGEAPQCACPTRESQFCPFPTHASDELPIMVDHKGLHIVNTNGVNYRVTMPIPPPPGALPVYINDNGDSVLKHKNFEYQIATAGSSSPGRPISYNQYGDKIVRIDGEEYPVILPGERIEPLPVIHHEGINILPYSKQLLASPFTDSLFVRARGIGWKPPQVGEETTVGHQLPGARKDFRYERWLDNPKNNSYEHWVKVPAIKEEKLPKIIEEDPIMTTKKTNRVRVRVRADGTPLTAPPKANVKPTRTLETSIFNPVAEDAAPAKNPLDGDLFDELSDDDDEEPPVSMQQPVKPSATTGKRKAASDEDKEEAATKKRKNGAGAAPAPQRKKAAPKKKVNKTVAKVMRG